MVGAVTVRPGSPEFGAALDAYLLASADPVVEPDESESCRNPGPRGCQCCDACAHIADEAYDRMGDR